MESTNDVTQSAVEDAPDQIIWIGNFLPVYPMFWRYILIAWAIVTAPLDIFFGCLGAWGAVVVINFAIGLIFGLAYLVAAWLSYRPKGGPKCLFAVTPEGAHYHAGDELRNFGQPLANVAAAATGNVQNLLMLQAAQSSNDLFIPWEKVKWFEVRPEMRLVFVSRGLYGPIPLFCTAENFESVRRYAVAHAPQARVKEQMPLDQDMPAP